MPLPNSARPAPGAAHLTEGKTRRGNPCWKVPSESLPGVFYTVVEAKPCGQFEGRTMPIWICTCPAFTTGLLEGGEFCKHITRIQQETGR